MRNGFSLVELSIVLVILGLLTGGILTGQNLIRAAELRSFVTDLQRYQTAANTFRDKYFSIPGDMRNATNFWGTDPNGCPHAVQVTGSQTCDGDGDGLIESQNYGSHSDETFRFWQHLANAGLIEGSYSGVSASATNHVALSSLNVPRGRLGDSYFYTGNTNMPSINSFAFSTLPRQRNVFVLGRPVVGNSDGDHPVILAEEAWNIDTKIDDSKPAYGLIQTYVNSQRPHCATTDDPTTAEYRITSTSTGCHIIAITAH